MIKHSIIMSATSAARPARAAVTVHARPRLGVVIVTVNSTRSRQPAPGPDGLGSGTGQPDACLLPRRDPLVLCGVADAAGLDERADLFLTRR